MSPFTVDGHQGGGSGCSGADGVDPRTGAVLGAGPSEGKESAAAQDLQHAIVQLPLTLFLHHDGRHSSCMCMGVHVCVHA